MHVVFDLDFDEGSWPGPSDQGATVGEAWLGPNGLVSRLELSLGLNGIFPTKAQRVACLVSRLGKPGFWSGSALVDPIGTAVRLLDWRDDLWSHGWRGQKTGAQRLDAIAELAGDINGGAPDRLSSITNTLDRRRTDVTKIELGTPREHLPAIWREVLTKLADRRVMVRDAAFRPASSTGNLANARRDGFQPSFSDPSLQLLRPPGPLAAAELVAAYLASVNDASTTVVVGGDPILDEAMRRFARPTAGACYPAQENALTQLLGNVLELAWSPVHPDRAFELLSHPDGPIPAVCARPLRRALQEWPSTTASTWMQGLEDALAAIDDLKRRADIRQRIETFFTPASSAEVGLNQLEPRVVALQHWLRARAATSTTPDDYLAAAAQSTSFLELVRASGLAVLTKTQARQMVALASPSKGTSRFPAEAHLHSVGQPGGVAAPADRIVWWNFTEVAGARLPTASLTNTERASLKSIGVSVQTRGDAAQRAAHRYKRPLWRANRTLLLVCPEVGVDGEQVHPHPLWDEITARLVRSDDRRALLRTAPVLESELSQSARPRAAVVAPRRAWSVPAGTVGARPKESPSSIGTLVGCPLRWALTYHARLSNAPAAAARVDGRLYGLIAHELLAELGRSGSFSLANITDVARQLFDKRVGDLASALFLPGAHHERAQLREVIAAAATRVGALVQKHGFTVVEVETERSRTIASIPLTGTPDLVLRAPGGTSVVVDFKWGGESVHREALKNGAAHQLAAYVELVADGGGPRPAAAYYVLRAQRIIADTIGLLPDAEELAFVSSADCWDATVKAYDEAIAGFSTGVCASGVADEAHQDLPERGEIVDGRLSLPAPCGFCDFHHLCGHAQQQGQR